MMDTLALLLLFWITKLVDSVLDSPCYRTSGTGFFSFLSGSRDGGCASDTVLVVDLFRLGAESRANLVECELIFLVEAYTRCV